jgi:hypothetical protein
MMQSGLFSQSNVSEDSASWKTRLHRWMTTDPAKRYSPQGLVAYYWTSGTPKACAVGNISSSGMYVVSDEPWLPGSVIPMTLQRANDAVPDDAVTEDEGRDAEDWIAVMTQVVRSGPDGRGLTFVFSNATDMFANEIPREKIADTKTLKRFIKHLNRS